MSRRSHLCGAITTGLHLWVLKTDGKGSYHISDPVALTTRGTSTEPSLTEVSRFHWQALIRCRAWQSFQQCACHVSNAVH